MKKINWNWGTGILIVIIIFLIVTISTTVFLMNQKVDLVSSDYYKKGIEHQKQIDKINRTNALDEKISVAPEAEIIRVTFPKDFTKKNYSGDIQFYRPSDSNKDFTLKLNIDSTGQQLIPTKNIDKGYWKVILNWSQDSIDYYKENAFVIN